MLLFKIQGAYYEYYTTAETIDISRFDVAHFVRYRQSGNIPSRSRGRGIFPLGSLHIEFNDSQITLTQTHLNSIYPRQDY